MRALITGAAGLLGQQVAKEYTARGFEVYALNKKELDISSYTSIKSGGLSPLCSQIIKDSLKIHQPSSLHCELSFAMCHGQAFYDPELKSDAIFPFLTSIIWLPLCRAVFHPAL